MTCPICHQSEEWTRERLRAGDMLAIVRAGAAHRAFLASFDDGDGAYFEECPPNIECHALGWLFAVRDELPDLADQFDHAIDMLMEFRNGHTLRAPDYSPVMFVATAALANREVKP